MNTHTDPTYLYNYVNYFCINWLMLISMCSERKGFITTFSAVTSVCHPRTNDAFSRRHSAAHSLPGSNGEVIMKQ